MVKSKVVPQFFLGYALPRVKIGKSPQVCTLRRFPEKPQ